jgi:hypothetical protein
VYVPFEYSTVFWFLIALLIQFRSDMPVSFLMSSSSYVQLINMGIYLSTPKTDKFSEDGENDKLKLGLSSMQGWRANMEDAVSLPLER